MSGTSTQYVEKLDVSGGDVVFSNVTNDLTLGITAQATGTATLNVPDLGGVNHNVAPFLTSGGTPAANKVVRMVDGVSTIQSAANVTLSGGDVFSGVVGVTGLASNDLTLTAVGAQDMVLAVTSGQNVTVTGGGLTVAEDLAVTGNATITGNLTVDGTTTTVDSQNVLISDNNLLLSSNYLTPASPKDGGIVVNYEPLATNSTTAATCFTATTVEVAAIGAFVAGMIILINGAAAPENDGLYRIDSVSLNVITVDPAPVDNFLSSAFTAAGSDTGVAVRNVTIAALQADASDSGRWEVAAGSTAPMTFTNLALTSELPSGTWTEVDVTTTNNTPNTSTTIAITTNKSSTLEVVYSARENGGAANVLNGKLTRVFYNASGTATEVGAGTKDQSVLGDGANWSIGTSGTGANMVITVTGDTGDTVDWRLLYRATESGPVTP